MPMMRKKSWMMKRRRMKRMKERKKKRMIMTTMREIMALVIRVREIPVVNLLTKP